MRGRLLTCSVVALLTVTSGVGTAAGEVTVVRLADAPDVRPGPAVLYAPAPPAPQLEATGIWSAPTLRTSGASAYDGGEFLYTDYLYDDLGDGTYTYPADAASTQNDADLVEVRLRDTADALAVRLTFQSMASPALVGTTIALGTSVTAMAMPFGANTVAPAEVFVTVHGTTGVATRALDGAVLDDALDVTVDLARRQVQVLVPHDVWAPTDPFRVAAAAGRWDEEADSYVGQGPGGAGSAFFNVAFRYDEGGAWFAEDQGPAVLAGDISPFFAEVDLGLLRSGADDDLAGTELGVPASGYIGRIYASHTELAQGRGKADVPVGGVANGGQPTPENCPETCILAYPNQLQPYGLYVPDVPEPAGGWVLTLDLHGANNPYTSQMFNQRGVQLGERGVGSLVLYPHERGEVNTYYGEAEADTFEAWADLARAYPIDPTRTAVTGGSMGGVGTYKYATEYPDLFAAAAPIVGYPYSWIGYAGPPDGPHTTASGEYNLFYSALPSLRNVPLMIWNSYSDELVPYAAVEPAISLLDEVGYRYVFYGFTLDHLSMGVTSAEDSNAIAAFLGDRQVDPDPAHVTYVQNSNFTDRRFGLDPDHAYWVSGVTARAAATEPDAYGSLATFAHVDVRSLGFGVGDPPALDAVTGAGSDAAAPHTTVTRDWGEAPATAVEDRLVLDLTNVAALTIDVARARVSCDAALDVTTDGPVTITLAGCGAAAAPTGGPGGGDLAATGAGDALAGAAAVLAAAVLARRRRAGGVGHAGSPVSRS